MSWPESYHAWRRTKKPYPLTLVKTTEPLPKTLGAHDVLLRIHAVSLNYRDHAMLQEGLYPVPIEDEGISASDCAAEVVAVGDAVRKFVVGDRVAPNVDLANLTGQERSKEDVALGGAAPGTLREYAIYEEKVLVKLPSHLSWEEASTLSCTGVTAWVALDRLSNVPEGATALLQGTGGVSLTALLLCIAAGIKPIITSSSDDKIAKIKNLYSSVEGINYKTCPDIAKEVLRITHGEGVDFILNNVGVSAIPDNLAIIRKQGHIALIGFLGGLSGSIPTAVLMNLIVKACRIQGLLGGSLRDYEALNAFIEEKQIRFDSIIDRVFEFDEVPAAYEYLASFKHTGKVVVRI